jgi:Uma2 family endonuclease
MRTGIRVSVAEFLELELPEPDHKLKMELDDGTLYIMPRPRLRHQSAQTLLAHHFLLHFDGFAEPPGEVYTDVVVALPSELPRLFAPDLTIILQNNEAVAGDLMVDGVPDITIEILSSDRNRDLVRKRQVYEEAGIPEYWILDELNQTALQLELRAGQYVERAALTAVDTLTTPLLPGLAIPLADVFRHRSRPAR